LKIDKLQKLKSHDDAERPGLSSVLDPYIGSKFLMGGAFCAIMPNFVGIGCTVADRDFSRFLSELQNALDDRT